MRDRELPPPRENPRDLPPMRERELPREPMRERELPREPREREGDKYATVRAPRRTEPQPLSAAALEYRSLQRPRRGGAGGGPGAHRRRPERAERHDHRDLYAVTEL